MTHFLECFCVEVSLLCRNGTVSKLHCVEMTGIQAAPPADQEPALVLQSAIQRDRPGQSERSAEHGAVLAQYPVNAQTGHCH